MKLFLVLVTSPFILGGCASVAPYQPPLLGESSASLSIELGDETGTVEISYGKNNSDDCFEFSILHKEKKSYFSSAKQQSVKQVAIPANGPQVLQYNRIDSNDYCEINLRFVPQQGGQYVLRTNNRYLKSESEFPLFFGGGPKRQCVVELFQKNASNLLSQVQFDRLPIKPTRWGFPGCPKILSKMRSAFVFGSERQFDLDTSGTMRRIP